MNIDGLLSITNTELEQLTIYEKTDLRAEIMVRIEILKDRQNSTENVSEALTCFEVLENLKKMSLWLFVKLNPVKFNALLTKIHYADVQPTIIAQSPNPEAANGRDGNVD